MAPGTPMSGNVRTALPDSHDSVVSPDSMTPSSNSVPGFAPSQKVSTDAATAAFGAPWGLAQKRMSRSSTVSRLGVAVPPVRPISAPRTSSSQA